jgi:hypothetical protein
VRIKNENIHWYAPYKENDSSLQAMENAWQDFETIEFPL